MLKVSLGWFSHCEVAAKLVMPRRNNEMRLKLVYPCSYHHHGGRRRTYGLVHGDDEFDAFFHKMQQNDIC